MTQRELETLVFSNGRWFAGVPRETGESLSAAERTLGVTLPHALKWLLSTHGYSDACGIPKMASQVSCHRIHSRSTIVGDVVAAATATG
jgi:hypothetical protein